MCCSGRIGNATDVQGVQQGSCQVQSDHCYKAIVAITLNWFLHPVLLSTRTLHYCKLILRTVQELKVAIPLMLCVSISGVGASCNNISLNYSARDCKYTKRSAMAGVHTYKS